MHLRSSLHWQGWPFFMSYEVEMLGNALKRKPDYQIDSQATENRFKYDLLCFNEAKSLKTMFGLRLIYL